MSMHVEHNQADSKQVAATGLRTAMNIMERWGATREQMGKILRVSASTLARSKAANGEGARLDDDQLDRISYVLNIHATLCTLFENSTNLYGFISMPNQNGFFNGRSPLEVISDGSFASLYETHRHIDGLRGAQW